MKPNSTASCASAASVSSMKSPSWASSSSPTVWSSVTRSRPYWKSSVTRCAVMSSSSAQLLLGRVAAELLVQQPAGPLQLVDLLDQVDGQPDGPALVGHRAGDGLPDPPGRVRRELEALGVVELLDRADQAEVALLDQVQERQAVAGVALGQRDDQPQVGLQQVLLGPAPVDGERLQVTALGRGQLGGRIGQQVVGVEPGLDPLGELDLLLGVEQRDLADLVEVDPDQVGGQRRGLLVQVRKTLVDLSAGVDGGGRVGTGRVRPHRRVAASGAAAT